MIKPILFLFILICTSLSYAGSYLPWRLSSISAKLDLHDVEIRAGYLAANPKVEFKGNVLYYQGLGDSMLNHDPMFEALIEQGYRIISFDYMGQGGSTGSMNHTTIQNINQLGDLVIKLMGRRHKVVGSKYHIIGWSTGGLAAYRKAYFDKGLSILSITLIAPGISPNFIVGEGFLNWPIDEITLRTLTSNIYIGVNNPHHDPIHPKTPLLVPQFAINLQKMALASRILWDIDPKVKGLVFLSGDNDTYVDSKLTKTSLTKKASHFKVITYKDALHEIDNEIEEIAQDLRNNITKFLGKL